LFHVAIGKIDVIVEMHAGVFREAHPTKLVLAAHACHVLLLFY
jgi:hypothetical protein